MPRVGDFATGKAADQRATQGGADSEFQLVDRLIARLLFPKAGKDAVTELIDDVASLSPDCLDALNEALMALMLDTHEAPRRRDAAALIAQGPLRARRHGFFAQGCEAWCRGFLPILWLAWEDTTSN